MAATLTITGEFRQVMSTAKTKESGQYNTVVLTNGTLYSCGYRTTVIMPMDNTKVFSIGKEANVTMAGTNQQACISGNQAKVTISGLNDRVFIDGAETRVVSTGYGTRIGNAGCDTEIVLHDGGAIIESEKPCTVYLYGPSCKFKLPFGSYITVEDSTHMVGDWFLLPNTWYIVRDGKIKRMKEEIIR